MRIHTRMHACTRFLHFTQSHSQQIIHFISTSIFVKNWKLQQMNETIDGLSVKVAQMCVAHIAPMANNLANMFATLAQKPGMRKMWLFGLDCVRLRASSFRTKLVLVRAMYVKKCVCACVLDVCVCAYAPAWECAIEYNVWVKMRSWSQSMCRKTARWYREVNALKCRWWFYQFACACVLMCSSSRAFVRACLMCAYECAIEYNVWVCESASK